MIEAYVVANKSFQCTGPFEVVQVLTEYVAATPDRTAIESLSSEYLFTSGGASAVLIDGVKCYVDIDGVVVTFNISRIGSDTFRILINRVNAARLNYTLDHEVSNLRDEFEKLRRHVLNQQPSLI
jgi:hypothetical protein